MFTEFYRVSLSWPQFYWARRGICFFLPGPNAINGRNDIEGVFKETLPGFFLFITEFSLIGQQQFPWPSTKLFYRVDTEFFLFSFCQTNSHCFWSSKVNGVLLELGGPWPVLNRFLLDFTGLYWVLPGFTGFYRVLPGFTGFYLVLLGFT